MTQAALPILFIVASLFPDFATAYDVCTPCPDGTEEIALLVSSEDLQHPGQLSSATRKTETRDYSLSNYKLGRVLPRINLTAKTPLQFHSRIRELAKQCKRIKYLSLFSHGAPGVIGLDAFAQKEPNWVSSDPITASNVSWYFKGLDCAMAPDAHINIRGCNVGRSCEGERLMKEFANVFLQKGGSIRAATTYELTFYGLTPFQTVLPRQLSVTAGLKEVKWNFRALGCPSTFLHAPRGEK